jgi:uncharacterized protein with HEPN domain
MKDTTRLLQDILDAITTIESYAVALQNGFLKDEKTQNAIMFNLIIMGEAANNIPREFKKCIQKSHGPRSFEQET